MRITGGAPGGSAAWRALAAAITSMTMNAGAWAPCPTFSPAISVAADRQPRAARVGGPAAGPLCVRQVARAGDDVGPARLGRRVGHGRTAAQRLRHGECGGQRRAGLP